MNARPVIHLTPGNGDLAPRAFTDTLGNHVVDLTPDSRCRVILAMSDPEAFLREWAANLTTLADAIGSERVAS